MDQEDERTLRKELERLQQQHRELNTTIERLLGTDKTDPVPIAVSEETEARIEGSNRRNRKPVVAGYHRLKRSLATPTTEPIIARFSAGDLTPWPNRNPRL